MNLVSFKKCEILSYLIIFSFIYFFFKNIADIQHPKIIFSLRYSLKYSIYESFKDLLLIK